MKSFDRIVLLILGAAAVLILLLVLLGDRVGVQVTAFFPEEGQSVSARGKIGLRFNQEMEQSSVEERFSIEPTMPGSFLWEDQTLWFNPLETWQPDQVYRFTIQAGAQSQDGREVLQEINWQAEVRQPDILYLALGEHGGDIWRLSLETGTAFQLTDTDYSIFDYAPHPAGESIAYSQVNENGGMDLVWVDRDGNFSNSLIACEQDICNQPAWSPDGVFIAYVRETYNSSEGRFEDPSVWTVHVQSGDTTPLYPTGTIYSHSPTFSPDGSRLASYDIDQEAIRVLNLETSEEFLIPSDFPTTGDWSPDGDAMVFIDLLPTEAEPFGGIYLADLVEGQITQALGDFIEGFDYSPPRWSPKDDWIAFSVRPIGGGVSKMLSVQKLGEHNPIQITQDLSATYSAYQWDPWGEQLVFQRFGLSATDRQPSIWLWDWETGVKRLLVENGARPIWLP